MLSLPAGFLVITNRDLPQVGSLWDSGEYTIAAKSLADGSGYRILNLPGQPWQTKFPPLYPLWLSLAWRLDPHFPSNLTGIGLLNFLILPPFLLLFRAVLIDLGTSEAWAWMGCALAAVTHVVLIFGTTPMSELLFCSLSFGVLLLLGRVTRKPHSALVAWLAGLLGGAAYLARTAALPLLFAGAAFLLLRRQRMQAVLFCAGMLLAMAGWNLWVSQHSQPPPDYVWAYYTSYADVIRMGVSLGSLPMLLAKNFLNLAASVVGIIVSLPFSGWWNLALAALGLALLAAVIVRARTRGVTQYHLFAFFYCAMLLIWPYEPSPRLLIPILPLLIATMLAKSKDWCISSQVAAIAVVAFWGCYQVTDVAAGLRQARAELSQKAQVYDWIRKSLPEDARFVTDSDSAVYLYTGRQAVGYQMPMNDWFSEPRWKAWINELPAFVERHGIAYALARNGISLTGVYTVNPAYEQSFLEKFEPVYANNGISIRAFPLTRK